MTIENRIQIVKCGPSYFDKRGFVRSIIKNEEFPIVFKEDRCSKSYKHVIRGLHTDHINWKYITILHGAAVIIAVDTNIHSTLYGKPQNFLMTEDAPRAILVPPWCLNGHLCLSDSCLLYYKWSERYTQPEEQVTVAYNDKTLDIDWNAFEVDYEFNDFIVSDRDKNGMTFKEFEDVTRL